MQIIAKLAFSLAVSGLISGWNAPAIICLVVGLILMILEMFTPGLGICGALGGIALIAAVVLRASTFTEALILIAVIIVFLVIVGVILYSSFNKGLISRSAIMLDEKIEGESTSLKSNSAALIDRKGVAMSYLRPAGIADFDGERLDVVTEGEFIEQGADVQIVRVDGLKIIVRRCSEAASDNE